MQFIVASIVMCRLLYSTARVYRFCMLLPLADSTVAFKWHMRDWRLLKYTLIMICHFEEKTRQKRNLVQFSTKSPKQDFVFKVGLTHKHDWIGWKSETRPFFLKTDTFLGLFLWSAFRVQNKRLFFAFLWSCMCTYCKLGWPQAFYYIPK